MKIIERIKKNKQNILIVLGLITLIALIGGVTFAFFNYTRTGAVNTVRVGEINFNSTQETINLTNVFPTSSDNLNSSNSATATINIEGNTTYSEGIEYKVSIVDVNNTINEKDVPISFQVDVTNLGTQSNDYYNERGNDANVYNLVEEGIASDNQLILIGYIKNDSVGVNGSIDITAFIDKEKVAVSDTVSKIENGELIYGGTKGEWIAGRTILTTEEWNSLTGNNPLSFRVKVEANEGIWVEEPKYTVMKNLHVANDTNWTNIRANITSVEFHTDGVAPANPISTIDATDITSDGPVTVYIVDDGLGNNTYKAIIVGNDVIYAPQDSTGLFRNMTKLVTFNSTNFKVNNVTNMLGFFANNENLTNISTISNWNTSNVTDMTAIFQNNYQLSNISSLINWNTRQVSSMRLMFKGCSSLTSLVALIKWNTSSVTTMQAMFKDCTSLENVDGLINWNTSNVNGMVAMFRNTKIEDVDCLINWNTSKVTTMQFMFADCLNLRDVRGLVNWDTSSVTNMEFLFGLNPGKKKVGNPVIDFASLANWNVGNVTNMYCMFQNVSILSFKPFKNWNVGKVENFSNMFVQETSDSVVTSLEGLENWNVSSATNMKAMFASLERLEDASAINNWNIKKGIDFSVMFGSTPVHPEFTKIPGTWDSNGTFTPSA